MLTLRRLLWKFNHSMLPLYIGAFFTVCALAYMAYYQDVSLHEAQVSDCKKAGGELKRVGLSGSKVIRRCIDDFGREMPY
jgi:hypothetical protein